MERVLVLNEPTENVFCATGPGGGVDPTCPAGGKMSSREAVAAYQKGKFNEINKALRTGVPLTEEQQAIMEGIDAAAKPLAKDAELYRGILRSGPEGEFLSTAKPGDRFTQAGYTSTGGKDTAIDYSGYGRQGPGQSPFSYMARVEVPKGTKTTKGTISALKDEHILPRGTVFEYVGSDGDVPVLKVVSPPTSNSDRTYVTNDFTENVFCPTGKGGGIDPTCPAGVSKRGHGDKAWSVGGNPSVTTAEVLREELAKMDLSSAAKIYAQTLSGGATTAKAAEHYSSKGEEGLHEYINSKNGPLVDEKELAFRQSTGQADSRGVDVEFIQSVAASKVLVDTIKKAPVETHQLYRSVSAASPIEGFEKLKAGDVTEAPRITSFSTDRSHAAYYGRKTGTGTNYEIQLVGPSQTISTDEFTGLGHKERITTGRFRVVSVSDGTKVKLPPAFKGSIGYSKTIVVEQILDEPISANVWSPVTYDRAYVTNDFTENVFCATGPGGGVDPTCPAGGEGAATSTNPQTGARSIKYKGQDAKVEPVGDGTFKIVDGPEGSVGRIIRPKTKETTPTSPPAPKTKAPKAPTPENTKPETPKKFKSSEEAEDHFSQATKTNLKKGKNVTDEEFLKQSTEIAGEYERLGKMKAVKKAMANRPGEQSLELGADFEDPQALGKYQTGRGILLGKGDSSDSPPVFGQHSVSGDSVIGSFRHEMGHEVMEFGMSNATKRSWVRVSEQYVGTNVVSRYGGTNASEMFAESFAAYTSKSYKRGSLPPEIESWMDANVRG